MFTYARAFSVSFLRRRSQMARLVKYCRPEHSPLNGCTTIRLGTLQYYRELDPDFQGIADMSEGLDTIEVNNLKMETATRDARSAVGGILPDMPYIHVSDMRLYQTFPNSYVFCCSILSKGNQRDRGAEFDPGYTSCYEIKDVPEFARRLAQMLNSTVRIDHFSDAAREQLKQLSIQEWGVTVGWYLGPVRYVPHKVSQIENGVLRSYVEEIPIKLRSVFVKPQKYENDQEFRMIFLMQHPRLGILDVRKDPVDLSILPIGEVPAELNSGDQSGARA
jgi:hypothetical protein